MSRKIYEMRKGNGMPEPKVPVYKGPYNGYHEMIPLHIYHPPKRVKQDGGSYLLTGGGFKEI